MINKLKHSFNKLFEDLFVDKQSQLDSFNVYNNRLRVIETELRLACKSIKFTDKNMLFNYFNTSYWVLVEPTEPLPTDYQLNQHEQTEQLLYVEDNEVSVKPYNAVSNKQLIDANLTIKEHNKQLLATEEFKQRALIDMMDGVLEKKWEDELKKDVPIPQCMIVYSYTYIIK